jgi:hypothetical protein
MAEKEQRLAQGSQTGGQNNRNEKGFRDVSDSHPILLQGAMELEITTLLAALTEVEEQSVGSFQFWQGKLGRRPVVLSQTGIGTAAAAAATALGCERFQPALVLNQGTAGGYTENLHPYDLVIGETWYNANARFRARYGKTYFLDLVALEGESKEREFTGSHPFLHHSNQDLVAWLDRESRHYTRDAACWDASPAGTSGTTSRMPLRPCSSRRGLCVKKWKRRRPAKWPPVWESPSGPCG